MQIKNYGDEVKNTKYKIHVFLVFIYILITPLSMVEIPGIGSAMKALSTLILFMGMLLLLSENITINFHNRLMLAWTAYVLYTCLSIFWSTDFISSLPIAIGLVQVYVISFVLAKFDLYEEDIRIIEFAWILVSLICLILFFGGAGKQIEYGRISIVLSSGGADPNEFCAYFYTPLAILIIRLFKSKLKLACFIYVIYMLVILYCIFLTGSRGGLLAAAATVSVSWMFSSAFSFKKIALLCVLMAVLYIVFIYFYIPNLPQALLERLYLSSMIEDKGSNRAFIWGTALNNIFSDTPRLIYGYGPYGVTFMRSAMHNQLIQVLMDGGIIGLILFVKFIAELIKKAYRNGPVFLGGVAGAFTALMTLTAYTYFKPVWVIYFMCLLTIKRSMIENQS